MIIPAMISGGALVINIMGKQYTNKAMKEQKNAFKNFDIQINLIFLEGMMFIH